MQRHQDIGQLDMYVHMFDDMKKRESDNPTIPVHVPVSTAFSYITAHFVFWKNQFYPEKEEPQKKKAFDRCRCSRQNHLTK